ncbi:MAG: 30S ribosomal protein S28e [Candidatus Micrarchaeota archaeon]|nr:30S ribosomal protein S28e [Candidatus Micrarchaeota archaeon]
MAAEENKEAKTEQPAAKQAQHEGQERRYEGYLAEVVEVNQNRTGIYGEIKQAMCKVLEGKDKGRVIRRNVAGRIYVGDIIRLPDTTREDKPIRAR